MKTEVVKRLYRLRKQRLSRRFWIKRCEIVNCKKVRFTEELVFTPEKSLMISSTQILCSHQARIKIKVLLSCLMTKYMKLSEDSILWNLNLKMRDTCLIQRLESNSLPIGG